MGKQRLTEFDLDQMGLVETSPGSGQYVKKDKIEKLTVRGIDVFLDKHKREKNEKFREEMEAKFDFGRGFNTEDKHQTIGFEVDDHIAREAIDAKRNSWKETGKIKYTTATPESFDGKRTDSIKNDEFGLFAQPTGMIDHVETGGREISYNDPNAVSEILSPAEFNRRLNEIPWQYIDQKTGNSMILGRRTEPFPIAEIRELTGKKRDIAVAELQEEAKNFVKGLNPFTEIYIPGNVASSKNSKQIFPRKDPTIKEYWEKGVLVRELKYTSFISESAVSVKYRKETKNYWTVNRLKFKAALEGLQKPYSIEFTLIRKTLGRCDFGNMGQLPADLMVEHKWFDDDETIEFHPVYNRVVFYSKYFAGLVIRVIR